MSEMETVGVKALEWSGPNAAPDGGKVWATIAEGMEFTYSIWHYDDENSRYFCAKVLPQQFATLEEAKSAVQQNYNDRILSAINRTEQPARAEEDRLRLENEKLRGDVRSYEITMRRISEVDTDEARSPLAWLLTSRKSGNKVLRFIEPANTIKNRTEWEWFPLRRAEQQS